VNRLPSKRFERLCRSVAGAAFLCFAGAAGADSVRVFTDRAHPVQMGARSDAQVIYLDAVKDIEAVLSEGLSGDPKQAEQQALALLHSARGRALQEELLQAWRGLAVAWRLGITHLPAVVMDGHVVYGETDVTRAVARMEAFMAREGR